MVYKRRNYHRRKPKRNLAALNKKVNKIARVTKPEIKELYTNMSPVSIDQNGGSGQISAGLAQGLTDESRVGNKVQALSFDMRGTIQAVGVSSSLVRVIFIKDKLAKVTLPIHVLRYTGANQVINSPYSDDFKQNFTVLSDRTYRVCPGQSNDLLAFHIKKRLDLPLLWDDAGAATKNPIKVFYYSNQPSGGSNLPIMSMSGDLKFTDC